MQIRINKFISETGYCSRREADKLIEAGRVTINGLKPEIGSKVSYTDLIEIDNKPIKPKEKLVICHKFIIPEICSQLGYNVEDVSIGDNELNTIINEYTIYTIYILFFIL